MTARLPRFAPLFLAGVLLGAGALGQRIADQPHDETPAARLTGDVKLVYYVSDVQASADYYQRVLGFRFHHFHDYDTGESVVQWDRDTPPIYAEMSAGGRRFGLHLPQSDADRACVGHMKVYYRVDDLDAHHAHVAAEGGDPGDIVDRPWMRFFLVTDPDGHRIYFAETDDEIHGNPWTVD